MVSTYFFKYFSFLAQMYLLLFGDSWLGHTGCCAQTALGLPGAASISQFRWRFASLALPPEPLILITKIPNN